jgi:hypothetical protein
MKSQSDGWKKIKKKKNKRLTIGVGYSGQAALRREQCDVHAVARFRGNKGGYLSIDYWMFPWNPFQERVFSLRMCLLCRPSRGHIFRTGS